LIHFLAGLRTDDDGLQQLLDELVIKWNGFHQAFNRSFSSILKKNNKSTIEFERRDLVDDYYQMFEQDVTRLYHFTPRFQMFRTVDDLQVIRLSQSYVRV
jgi:hypothetical protein